MVLLLKDEKSWLLVKASYCFPRLVCWPSLRGQHTLKAVYDVRLPAHPSALHHDDSLQGEGMPTRGRLPSRAVATWTPLVSGCFGGACPTPGFRSSRMRRSRPLGSGRLGGAGLAPCRFGFADRQEMPDHALTGASETTFNVSCAVQHLLVSLG